MFAENPDLAWEGDEPTVCRLIRAWEPVNTCHWPNVRLRCVQTAMPALPAPKPPASLARAGRALGGYAFNGSRWPLLAYGKPPPSPRLHAQRLHSGTRDGAPQVLFSAKLKVAPASLPALLGLRPNRTLAVAFAGGRVM
jgi:hypothetical protein